MRKLKNHTITTYIYKNVWRIDIVNNRSTYEAWLYHRDYGIKTLMFSMESNDFESLDKFIELVEINATDYCQIYRDEYMEEYKND